MLNACAARDGRFGRLEQERSAAPGRRKRAALPSWAKFRMQGDDGMTTTFSSRVGLLGGPTERRGRMTFELCTDAWPRLSVRDMSLGCPSYAILNLGKTSTQ